MTKYSREELSQRNIHKKVLSDDMPNNSTSFQSRIIRLDSSNPFLARFLQYRASKPIVTLPGQHCTWPGIETFSIIIQSKQQQVGKCRRAPSPQYCVYILYVCLSACLDDFQCRSYFKIMSSPTTVFWWYTESRFENTTQKGKIISFKKYNGNFFSCTF